MTRLRSQLSGLPSGPTPDADIRKMAGACWHKRSIVILWLEDLADDWERQMVTNIADRTYGKRNAID